MREYVEADRPALLDLLKLQGALNVPALVGFLNVNPTAVRQQLAVLVREGLVEMRVERRRVGRPTHVWSLTPKAEALFPQSYGPFAVWLLRQVREIDGERKIDRLLARRSRQLSDSYKKRLSGKSRGDKFRELARIRSEEGYMARARGRGLTEHHCPIAALARAFPTVCAHEKRLFESVLKMKLARTEHIAAGGSACVYRPASDPAD